eukprot:XP_011428652.1 PREDICTED: uncharacterized protein LOC105329157 isoform X2 [Crassostrea gigas]
MFMILVILVVQVDARCGVSEGVVQCRDWREFESGNYPMANFLILERAVGEINMEGYLALTRLVIHDPQADCEDIKTNPWTTVRIGSLTCQNAQHSSGVKDMITTTTLRTVELEVITFMIILTLCVRRRGQDLHMRAPTPPPVMPAPQPAPLRRSTRQRRAPTRLSY